jgi:hypothetical protein
MIDSFICLFVLFVLFIYFLFGGLFFFLFLVFCVVQWCFAAKGCAIFWSARYDSPHPFVPIVLSSSGWQPFTCVPCAHPSISSIHACRPKTLTPPVISGEDKDDGGLAARFDYQGTRDYTYVKEKGESKSQVVFPRQHVLLRGCGS